jgi:release factor glutamine methyltransferase
MTVKEAISDIRQQLARVYDEGEAGAITDWLMEYITGDSKSGRIASLPGLTLTSAQRSQVNELLPRLLQQEPIQYVLNEAWFCGLKFYVDKNVLIPRPETEELVEWIISNCKFPLDTLGILDIGSGSGCIPIALKRRLRKADVCSCDISEAALAVAQRNALTLGTNVTFLYRNFLDPQQWDALPSADIIVSNPPYVPEKDKATMQPNVLRYEPHTALFVPDNDALIFYRAIASFGKTKLNSGGSIYMEIHESLGNEVRELFTKEGYTTEIKKDMQGKERMIMARQTSH